MRLASRSRYSLLGLLAAALALAGCARGTPTGAPLQTYTDLPTGVTLDFPQAWVIAASQPGQLAILQSYPIDKYEGGEDFLPGDTKCDLVLRPAGTTPERIEAELEADSEISVVEARDLPLDAGGAGRLLRVTGRGSEWGLALAALGEQTVTLECYGTLDPLAEMAGSLRVVQAPP